MAKVSVTSSLFFAYHLLFLHVTSGELALVAQMRKEHAQYQVDYCLDGEQVKFWRHIVNISAHLLNRKPCRYRKRTRQDVRNRDHPIRHQISRPAKVSEEQYRYRQIEEELHARFAMQEHLRKAHSEIDDRRKEHHCKHHHRQEFATTWEVEEIVDEAMVEQDKTAIMQEVRKSTAQVTVLKALVFNFGIAIVTAETTMTTSTAHNANTDNQRLLQNHHKNARDNIIRIAPSIVIHRLDR